MLPVAAVSRRPTLRATRYAGSVAVDGSVLGIDPGLRSALRSLPERDLHLLTLVVFEDLSLADAAAVLHITESAAKTRLHRVRHRVRAQLGDLDTPSTTQGGQR